MSDSGRLSRRSFLSTSLAGAALPLVGTALPAARCGSPMRILVIGGTGFLGPAVVEHAVARGHALTLFNRGRTNAGMFESLPQIHGDRRKPEDVAQLRDGEWDAVIDNVAYFPRDVDLVAEALQGRVQHYVVTSSVSVYPMFGTNRDTVDEDSPVGELKEENPTGITEQNYGPLKAACERRAEAAFPGRCTAVRPGYIVGPLDRSDRFTYWPVRLARGGEVLAPGNPDSEFQVIDVRDLGAWMVHLVEERTFGRFNAVGYAGGYTLREVLHGGKCMLEDRTTFTWVSDQFLEANGVSSWGDLPWTPEAQLGHIDNRRALAAGLSCRPIGETIRDTWDWAQRRPADYRPRTGLSAERETELLAKWRQR